MAELTVELVDARRLPPSARKPELIKRAAALGLGSRARKGGELSVLFVTDRQIRALNRKHLRHDYETDVIAFPYDAPMIGDIVISVDRAKAQADELGHSILEEVLTLAAHGALHLAGYDDHKAADKKRMFAAQARIVRACLKGRRP